MKGWYDLMANSKPKKPYLRYIAHLDDQDLLGYLPITDEKAYESMALGLKVAWCSARPHNYRKTIPGQVGSPETIFVMPNRKD